MPDLSLRRLTDSSDPVELITDELRLSGTPEKADEADTELVLRGPDPDNDAIGLAGLDALMDEFKTVHPLDGASQKARAESDRWLAPRFHWALRLTRREAGDWRMWTWLAVCRYPEYVVARWPSVKDGLPSPTNRDRFDGAVNKQAFARLWWGAELYRNGTDYSPVEATFSMQDIPNSFLHHRSFESKPLAIASLEVLERVVDTVAEGESRAESDTVQAYGRVLNLWLAGTSLEAAVPFWQSDTEAFRQWVVAQDSAPPFDLATSGPPDGEVTSEALAAALEIAEAVAAHAQLAASNDTGEWSPDELEASVIAYGKMLAAEQSGTKYVKAQFRRDLRAGPLSKRKDSSIEFRFQNISAVLESHGCERIDGYTPATHVGAQVAEVLWNLIQEHDLCS